MLDWLWIALGLLPWVAVLVFAILRVRALPGFPPDRPRPASTPPLVSVIVPARNEEHNIAECLATLVVTDYPRFEVVIVDDQSTDRTGEVARTVPAGNARRVEVIRGEPLPPGWFGKPWACWQGYRRAAGEILLFTDADTRHGTHLLAGAVAALEAEQAAAVTVLGRQRLVSFWERTVMPQMMLALVLRFANLSRPCEPRSWRSAIANGQFLLLRRSAYEAVGGHEAVRGEVAEDLRLAQELCRTGHRLVIRGAEDHLETRMYRSLSEILEGWTKNIATGGQQSFPPWAAPFALPLLVVYLLGFWLLPPAVLGAALAGAVGPGAASGGSDAGGALFGGSLAAWAAGACGLSLLMWSAVCHRLRVPAANALLYPIGAAVAAVIVIRSAIRGQRIEWKGRWYGGSGGSGDS
ncbi:MAG: glycosyltransferase [Gemmatimonadetes bacterium]|nr:glycosyltransferase [Gemmatimonadota bacterium]